MSEMTYRRMGKAGLRLSTFSIGSWVTFGSQVNDDVTRACLIAAYEGGVNFIDSAEAYADGAAEESVGRVVKELRRESLVLSSKVFWGGNGPNDKGLSRKHVTEACHAALRRLQTDYLDLYYCHRPDPETPIEETVRAMDVLIRQGKVLYWGTSEWSYAEIEQAYQIAKAIGATPPSVEQPQYNLFARHRVETEYKPLYAAYGMGTTIWSPLASGVLTGKYNESIPVGSRLAMERMAWLQRGVSVTRIHAVRRVTAIALELGCTAGQLALAWCAANPNVSSVITGASRPEQVRENLAALEVIPKLTPDVLGRISAAVADAQNLPDGSPRA
ncbi:NADP-dependent aryl-alcohol dehydrogenase [Deltaproteobacteria bacterium]|nr:NADP-dependent aryl-alcohol dehydrogenase [Deltaproteobacteria bacterium]